MKKRDITTVTLYEIVSDATTIVLDESNITKNDICRIVTNIMNSDDFDDLLMQEIIKLKNEKEEK